MLLAVFATVYQIPLLFGKDRQSNKLWLMKLSLPNKVVLGKGSQIFTGHPLS